MARIMINGIDTYYEELGSGDEVFLYVQHGGESKNELLSLLQPTYHIYAVDLPGFGRSTNLKNYRGLKQWSDDIYTFSRMLSIDKFIYTGFSMTGQIGYQLAYDHPEAVKALIAIVSIPIPRVPPPNPEEQKALDSGNMEEHEALAQKGFLFPKPTTDKERIRRRKEFQKQAEQKIQANKSDNEARAFLQDQILRTKEGRENFVPHLKELKVPVLILLGAHDWANPIDQSVVSAMSIPGAKAVFFEDYGHGLNIESPEKVAGEIILFINDLKRKREYI